MGEGSIGGIRQIQSLAEPVLKRIDWLQKFDSGSRLVVFRTSRKLNGAVRGQASSTDGNVKETGQQMTVGRDVKDRRGAV